MKIKPGLFALLIGGFMFILLTSFVYAFIQQAEAERQAARAVEYERKALECQQNSQNINQQLSDQTQMLRLTVEEVTKKIRLLEEQVPIKSKK
jgi:hypothetical protein